MTTNEAITGASICEASCYLCVCVAAKGLNWRSRRSDHLDEHGLASRAIDIVSHSDRQTDGPITLLIIMPPWPPLNSSPLAGWLFLSRGHTPSSGCPLKACSLVHLPPWCSGKLRLAAQGKHNIIIRQLLTTGPPSTAVVAPAMQGRQLRPESGRRQESQWSCLSQRVKSPAKSNLMIYYYHHHPQLVAADWLAGWRTYIVLYAPSLMHL